MSKTTVLFPIFAVLLLVGFVQCRRSDSTAPNAAPQAAFQPKQDHFRLALELLGRLDEFDPSKGMVQCAYHLNRWFETHRETVAWEVDPMVAKLPSRVRNILPLQTLDKRQLTTSDIRYLQEAFWLQSISEQLATQSPDEEARTWLDRVEKDHGEPHRYEVGLAMRLFDWTIRNIQLEQLAPYPVHVSGPSADGGGEGSKVSPIARAVAGPGYMTYPWQTLLFGRGDAWQRARVFLLLCRQQQISGVMLAFDNLQDAPRPRPWLPAVLIDDQLYLFDTQLGLPIPGPDDQVVATLDQVLDDRELLRGLAVGEAHPYVAADADFEKLVALIDASPEALSLRMKVVQAQARSTSPLSLVVEPKTLAERLRDLPAIERVELWNTPYETWIYRSALRRLAGRENPGLAVQLAMEDWLFGGTHPLVLGRIQYLRGNYEVTDESPGAKGYFRRARIPNSKLDQLETSQEVQLQLGILRGRENDQEWAMRLQNERNIRTGVKQTANYWLGLVHEATERYDAAIDWLGARTLDESETNPWRAGARYNLARVHISLGNLEEARKLLLLDDSPQQHGDLLLARFLRRQMERNASGKE